jgi:ligand-binding SRPBCC domain-containing protein
VSVQRTISEVIPAAPEVVRAFYVDLDNIKTLHPLVVAVRRTGRTESDDGYRQSYQVLDRIPLGPISFPVTYAATLQVPDAGDVLTEARQFPGVRLDGRVSFVAVDGGTLLTERVDIAAPWPLTGFTVQQAVAAHTEMLAGIRRHFEG